MAVEIADFERVKKRVVSLLNIGEEDDLYSGEVEELGEYTTDEVKDAIFEAEALLVMEIIKNAASPFRNQFVSAVGVEVLASAELPVLLAGHDKIETYVGTTWKLGKQLRNLSRYHAIADNDDLDDAIRQRYYFIEFGRLYTVAAKARVFVPEYASDRGGSALQIPETFERGVIAWAILGLYKGSTDSETHTFYSSQAQLFLQLASGERTNIPKEEKIRKEEG